MEYIKLKTFIHICDTKDNAKGSLNVIKGSLKRLDRGHFTKLAQGPSLS